jgi:hypothetical protein
MSDSNKIAVETLGAKAAELLEERTRVRRRLLADAARDVEIDRDVAGCVAGAKALGADLALPHRPDMSAQQKQSAFQNFINGRNAIVGAYTHLRSDYGLAEDESDDSADETAEPRPDMPRFAYIILDRLKVAGTEGSKAATIRKYILDTYDADFHEKTVGMTLNRLQKYQLVHRDGHTWSLGAAPEGPSTDGQPPFSSEAQ